MHLLAPLLLLAAAPAAAADLTYFHDVQPIIAGRCAGCHQPGGIAPFSLQSYDQVVANKDRIVAAVQSRVMPPWPADDACNDYKDDRSLTAEQIRTLTQWAAAGAPAGDPAFTGTPLPPISLDLPHPDLTLTLPEPYTPTLAPDEYRCFVLDWPYADTRYVTGLGVKPDNGRIVHHVLSYIVPPEGLAQVNKLNGADGRQGYSCFGDSHIDTSQFLGGWAPGTQGITMPAGTGILIKPGSKIVLQVHYHLHGEAGAAPPMTDQSAIALNVADHVEKPGYFIAWLDPKWLYDYDSMLIPAGAVDAQHNFSADITTLMNQGRPVTVYGAMHHMHQLGRSGRISVDRAGGRNECLVDIPKWDFDWQLYYALSKPTVLYRGDALRIDCHWDNSAANQPLVDGQRLEPRAVSWGNGTRDEMCLGAIYVVPEPANGP